jgi:hypothetical protein
MRTSQRLQTLQAWRPKACCVADLPGTCGCRTTCCQTFIESGLCQSDRDTQYVVLGSVQRTVRV